MGLAKAEMMRLYELQDLAMSVALQAKAVEECPLHDGIFVDMEDPDAQEWAYAIGTNKWKADEVDGTREEFMDAIKAAFETAGSECPICAKYRDA